MGRKAKFDETVVPKGPGRKAKKQGDPTFPKGVLGTENCSSVYFILKCELHNSLLQ